MNLPREFVAMPSWHYDRGADGVVDAIGVCLELIGMHGEQKDGQGVQGAPEMPVGETIEVMPQHQTLTPNIFRLGTLPTLDWDHIGRPKPAKSTRPLNRGMQT
jgi:hypothetical protein